MKNMTAIVETKPTTLVMKFGGTSVGSAEAMRQVMEILVEESNNWKNIAVVISAMSGVTDLLINSALDAKLGRSETFHQAASELRRQHYAVVEELIPDLAWQAQVKHEVDHLISDFVNLCQAITVIGEASPRALDAVAALGERLSVRTLAAVLDANGVLAQYVEATQLIIADNEFQAAHPNFEASKRHSRQVLEPIFSKGRIPVVTGFIAATADGATVTLGRGGSDYSAAILGAVLPADEVWIWTDVDGVMTSDPRLVGSARTIPELSYREIAELAYFGAKVVHPKTIRPVIEAGIPLRVCNTFNPTNPGTRVVAKSRGQVDGAIKAVTAIQGQSLVTLEGRGMLGVPGVAARTFAAVAATGTSVPLITQASSEQSICFAVPIEAVDQVVASLEAAFETELYSQDIDRVWSTNEVVIITVVGPGLRSTPGIAGRIFTALGKQDVNVIAVAQGSSEVSLSLVVDAAEAEMGLKALHELITEEVIND
jgi:aspartate kinase